jgi:aryl-alcohol dehydrogenase-like predicted oxidoreductase
MQQRVLKNTELKLSNICFGTGGFGNTVTKEEAFLCLDAFLDGGGNFIDTANVYCKWVPGLQNSSERILGAWLRERKSSHNVIIATKGGHYNFDQPEISRVNKAALQTDLEESLTTMGIDTIDFYWLHRDNPKKGIAEIIDMMEEFVKSGKIRYYGASNYSKERMDEAISYAQKKQVTGFCAVSNQWSLAKINANKNQNADPTLVLTDESYLNWHKETGMPLIPYSASAQGVFQKMYLEQQLSPSMKDAYQNEPNLKMLARLVQLKEETGMSIFALSLALMMKQPFMVFPITSASNLEQMKDIIAAGQCTL